MKKSFSKYFVISLSLLLILSNFSYASHLMLCGMSDDVKVCECDHGTSEQNKDLSYTGENTKCCIEEITEFSNANILSVVKTELPKDVNSFVALILNLNQNSELYISSLLIAPIDKSHLPILDIPIFTSSLLI